MTDGRKAWEKGVLMQFELHLEAGWNLVSIPLLPQDPGTGAVFDELEDETVWTWNGDMYTPVEELRPKRGYWVHSRTEHELTVTGWEPANARLQMNGPGWHLIGVLEAGEIPQHENIATPVWTWNDGWAAAAGVATGHAYWLYCTDSVSIDLTAP